MKTLLSASLVFWLLFSLSSLGFGQNSTSHTFSADSARAETTLLKDSIVSLNQRLAEITSEKVKENPSDDGYLSTISIVFSILLVLFTGILGLITHFTIRARTEAKEDLEKLEKRFELIDNRQKAVLDEMDQYLDSILITFNQLLPQEARIKLKLLKHVLYLRHYDERERFIAIKSLGQLGDESVIGYLEVVAEKDPKWAADARIAIEDIKKRTAQSQVSNAP